MTATETIVMLAIALPLVMAGDFALFVLRERAMRRARERAVTEWRLREALRKLRDVEGK